MLGKPLVRFCEGPGRNLDHGRDHVAPPGNQAANREDKHRPTVREVPGLLETPTTRHNHEFIEPGPFSLWRTGKDLTPRSMSGSARGRVATRTTGAIMWHRRETRRQTEKTNIALPSGKCPVYSEPRHTA